MRRGSMLSGYQINTNFSNKHIAITAITAEISYKFI